jgi:hypothetical protein
LQAELSEVMIRTGERFVRREARVHTGSFLFGLLSVARVRNCWTLAEHAGHASPDALQHLLATPSPSPNPGKPLPTVSRSTQPVITKSGSSLRSRRRRTPSELSRGRCGRPRSD